MKVVKFDGMLGQYGFKGQEVLFVQVSEKLPTMLPRSSDNIGITDATEYIENLQVTRGLSRFGGRVYKALRWLISNDLLYRDVRITKKIYCLCNDPNLSNQCLES